MSVCWDVWRNVSKDDLITNHHVDLVVGPDAYLSLPDLIAAVEAGEKAINVELSTTETYRDVIPSRICGKPHLRLCLHHARLSITSVPTVVPYARTGNAAVMWKVS